MKKVFAAVLIAGLAVTTQAEAGGGYYGERGYGNGAAIAAGVLGIIAGAINRPRYYYPAPVYGPYEYGPYEVNPYNNPYPYYGYPGPYNGPYPRYGYGYGRRDYGRPGYGYQGPRDYGRPGYGYQGRRDYGRPGYGR